METLDLPIVEATTPLADVIKKMQDSGKHAVVVRQPNHRMHLFTNRDVLTALRSAKTDLSDASLGEFSVVRRVVRPDKLSSDEDSMGELEEQGVLFGMVSEKKGMATVVTHHDSVAELIKTAQRVCHCDNDLTHSETEPPAEHGKQCRNCNGTYNCF
jgi:hypothetical protein